ncbi:MAG: glycosyltransferase [Verrucomicrobia bacterium]|nr:glycosyltransferase [Verrucomicrobiota bacterium]MCG2679302.1 glycosyltransferase [Kiritimatiellia bacterium]MBU4247321.1 glycosyltransferase [Verrucomicrobiota bacterium]MBU4292261.1 glycosyltransferase [Verrucomicrobiota bacterium]MBU4428281.1 glycosyltransferase [Verrucomicrobiota bacterium]
MKTSVIITVYNRPEMLIACLRALAFQSAPIDEAVVSDDGSDEAATRRMKAVFGEFPFPVRYIWQEDQGYHLAAARNKAIRKSSGDYLISLDCDILLLPDAVAVHLRQARRGVFLAANRAWVGEEETRELFTRQLSSQLIDLFWDRADRSHLQPTHRRFMRNLWLRKLGLARRHKPKILGCHFSLFREDIERVNGFDERYVGWGLEDDDFALRLHQAEVRGQSLILEARALHLWHPSAMSHPGHAEDSPNRAYFNRPDVPTYCHQGLFKE